jgi:hypothetical protein
VSIELRDAQQSNFFLSLGWSVLSARGEPHFITTDTPLLFSAGLPTRAQVFVTLALSPDMLFFAHPAEWRLEETKELAETLVCGHNTLLLRAGTHRFVYASEEVDTDLRNRINASFDDVTNEASFAARNKPRRKPR